MSKKNDPVQMFGKFLFYIAFITFIVTMSAADTDGPLFPVIMILYFESIVIMAVTKDAVFYRKKRQIRH